MTVAAGTYWRHYKGHLYEVLMIANHSEERVRLNYPHSGPRPMVVYREVDEDGAPYGHEKPWVRPLSMWEEQVDPHSYHSAELDQGVEKGTVARFTPVTLRSRAALSMRSG